MKKYIAALFAFLIAAPAARADWFAEYVSYKSSPDLGQVVVEAGRIRGKHNVIRVHKQQAALAAKNIFIGAGNEDQKYKRSCTIGGHKVSTTIIIHPPIGHGYGGANYTAELIATIDGKEKVHCNLGYLAQANNLHVERVVIYPEDQFIQMTATAGDVNKAVNPPIRHCLFSDPHVISNESMIYAR